MKRFHLRILVISLLLLFLTLLLGCAHTSSTNGLDAKLTEEGIMITNPDIFLGYALQEEIVHREPTMKKTLYFASKANGHLHITLFSHMDAMKAENYLELQETLTDSIYNDVVSPYPGEISKRIQCNIDFLPKKREARSDNIAAISFDAFATSRLFIGACTEDTAVYRSSIIFAYCPQSSTLYEIKHFIPKNSTQTVLNASSLVCLSIKEP